jgi:hypothetical protein
MTDAPIPRRIAPESGPHLWTAEALSPADWMLPAASPTAGQAPVPEPVLARLAERLAHGQGFALLRGLRAPEDGDALLAALAPRLGEVVAAPAGQGRFLTPACDILLLLCRASTTVTLRSAAAVHNALYRTEREALGVFYRPLPHGEDLDLPVFAVSGGVFSARLDRDAIARGTPAPALAALDAALDTPGVALRLLLHPGDVLCVNPFLAWVEGGPGLAMLGLRAHADSRLDEGAYAGLRA